MKIRRPVNRHSLSLHFSTSILLAHKPVTNQNSQNTCTFPPKQTLFEYLTPIFDMDPQPLKTNNSQTAISPIIILLLLLLAMFSDNPTLQSRRRRRRRRPSIATISRPQRVCFFCWVVRLFFSRKDTHTDCFHRHTHPLPLRHRDPNSRVAWKTSTSIWKNPMKISHPPKDPEHSLSNAEKRVIIHFGCIRKY